MSHGMMLGMLLGGIMLSAVPIALGVVLFVFGIREYRADRATERGGS